MNWNELIYLIFNVFGNQYVKKHTKRRTWIFYFPGLKLGLRPILFLFDSTRSPAKGPSLSASKSSTFLLSLTNSSIMFSWSGTVFSSWLFSKTPSSRSQPSVFISLLRRRCWRDALTRRRRRVERRRRGRIMTEILVLQTRNEEVSDVAFLVSLSWRHT